MTLSRKLIAIGKTLFGSYHGIRTKERVSNESRVVCPEIRLMALFVGGYGDVEFTSRKERELITILIAKSSGGQETQRVRGRVLMTLVM